MFIPFFCLYFKNRHCEARSNPNYTSRFCKSDYLVPTGDMFKMGVLLSLSKHGGQASARESSTGSD
jgi:hypothetical protein